MSPIRITQVFSTNFVFAALLLQLAWPQAIVHADPPKGEETNSGEQATAYPPVDDTGAFIGPHFGMPEQQARPHETLATSGGNEFADEIDSGRVKPAKDLDGLGKQILRYARKKGVFTQTKWLHDPNFKRPVISLANFDTDVHVFTREAHENQPPELVFALGYADRAEGFIVTEEHAILGKNVLGEPLLADNWVQVITQSADGKPLYIEMLSKENFVGFTEDGKRIRGSGFYSNLPISKVLRLDHLPRTWKILKLGTHGYNEKPQQLYRWDTFEPLPPHVLVAEGDRIIHVQDQDGTEMRLWVPYKTLERNYEKRQLGLLRNAYHDRGGVDDHEMAAERAFLKQMADADTEVQEINQEILDQLVDTSNEAQEMELAIKGLRSLNIAWMSANLIKKEQELLNKKLQKETVLRNRIERLTEEQRQRFAADPSDEGEWAQNNALIQSALDRKVLKEEEVNAGTRSFAKGIFAEQARLDLLKLPAQIRAEQRKANITKKFVRTMLNPTYFTFLAAVVAGGTAGYFIDSAPSEFLASIGSRILEYSAGIELHGQQYVPGFKLSEQPGVFGNHPVWEVVHPISSTGYLVADSIHQGASGVGRLALIGSGIVAATSTLFMVQLAAWGWGRTWSRSGVPLVGNVKGAMKDALTRLGRMYGIMQRTVQERLLRRVQPNLYPYIYNTGDKAHFWKGLSLPFNSETKAAKIEKEMAEKENLKVFVNRLAGLLTAASELRISPELLALSQDERGMRTLLNDIQTRPDKLAEFMRMRVLLSQNLISLYERGEAALGDEKQSRESYEHYLKKGQAIIAAANRPEDQDVIKSTWRYVCRTTSSAFKPLYDYGVRRPAAFVRDNLLGLPSGLKANLTERQELSDKVVDMQLGMSIPDYTYSNAAMAVIDPELFMPIFPLSEIGDKSMLAVQTADQAVSWNTVPQSDLANNIAADSSMANYYPPLASLIHDPKIGKVKREQTLDEALVAIAKASTDKDPNGTGIMRSWLGYFKAAIEGHQARAALLFLGLSLGLAGMDAERAKAGIETFGWEKISLLTFIFSYIVIVRKISVSNPTATPLEATPTDIGYAGVWPVANTLVEWTSDPVTNNQKRIQTAMGLLDSPDPVEQNQGIYEAKLLYAEGQKWISRNLPDELNVATEEYTPGLRGRLKQHMVDHPPLPTEKNSFVNLGANLGAALVSTILYYSMYGGFLADNDMTGWKAAGLFAHYAGWYAASWIGVKAFTETVTPLATAVVQPPRKAVGWATDQLRSCARRLRGIEPINTK